MAIKTLIAATVAALSMAGTAYANVTNPTDEEGIAALVFLGVVLLLGYWAMTIARKKNRGKVRWFLLGMFGQIWAILWVALLKPLPNKETTMKSLALIAALTAFALPAAAQWTSTTMPLGSGWQSHQGYGPNGQSYTGTTMPLGSGWSSTTFQDNGGRSTTCTTMPMGSGFTSTTCQ